MTELKGSRSASRLEFYARWIFIFLSLMPCVYRFYIGDWVSAAAAGLTIILLLLPPLLEKLLKITLPNSYKYIYLVFIIASMYLGELHSFFYRIVWWDIMLHTASAMMLAYLTWLLAYVINHDADLDKKVRPFFIALFVFCVPVALGAIWEMFEFAADKVLGVNMIKAIAPGDITRFYDYQRGFYNSLHDMIMDTSGALLVAIGVYLHLFKKDKSKSGFSILINQFIDANPSIFKKIV